MSHTPKNPPGPSSLPFCLDIRRRGPEALLSAARRYGDVVRFRLGRRVVFIINNAEHARHVLQEGARKYGKSPGIRKVRLFLGDGLLSSEGEHWKRHRRSMMPTFHEVETSLFADIVS